MTEDSLVFVNVPYGNYEGTATIDGSVPVYSDTIVEENNNQLVFDFILGATNQHSFNTLVSVLPNPVTSESRIVVETTQTTNLTLELFDASGISIGKREFGLTDKGLHEWPLVILTGQRTLSQGIYLLKIKANNMLISRKLIIQGN
ncbi:MAG: T9SS type A sorting domain-containing protein [Lentimicrobium sp.]|nr:T9SS type A sorting domain-containing protein [Lentimicrobium sp.]